MSAAIYHQAIKDLARAAHGASLSDDWDREWILDNPFCGDRIHLRLRLDATIIANLTHRTHGCLLCQASASLLGLRGPGLDRSGAQVQSDAVRALLRGEPLPATAWPELRLFEPAGPFRSRHTCVLLPFEALLSAMDR